MGTEGTQGRRTHPHPKPPPSPNPSPLLSAFKSEQIWRNPPETAGPGGDPAAAGSLPHGKKKTKNEKKNVKCNG